MMTPLMRRPLMLSRRGWKRAFAAALLPLAALSQGPLVAADYTQNPFTLAYEGAITENRQGAVNIHPVRYDLNGITISANVYTPVVPDFATFDTVFLGFPIWGGTAPPVIRSFLSAHDLSGKTLRPFITHGGYGPGSSLDVLGDHAAGAAIVDPFILEADQERRTMNQVRGWLDENQLR